MPQVAHAGDLGGGGRGGGEHGDEDAPDGGHVGGRDRGDEDGEGPAGGEEKRAQLPVDVAERVGGQQLDGEGGQDLDEDDGRSGVGDDEVAGGEDDAGEDDVAEACGGLSKWLEEGHGESRMRYGRERTEDGVTSNDFDALVAQSLHGLAPLMALRAKHDVAELSLEK